MPKTYPKLSIAALVAVAMLAACSKPAPTEEPIRAVRVITVGEASFDATYEFAAEVRARSESRLSFRVAGKMIRRQAELGQRVKAGQVLAQLDPQDYKLAADAAQAQVAAAATNRDLAAADFKRFKELKEQNFISGAELERRESVLKAAQATLQQTQAQLSSQGNQARYTNLVADVSGVVTAVEAEPGQVVTAGTPVLQLRDPTLDREQVTRQAMVDSLSAELTRADAGRASGASEVLRANIDAAAASASEMRARVGELRVTATIAGTVATSRPEQLTGRSVLIGDTLLTLTDVAQREAIIHLRGAGAMDVRVGQMVRYVGQQDVGQPMRGVISSVSPIGGSVGAVEARVQLSPESTLRLGATGEARVLWRRTNVLGAIVWGLRSALRNDLLL